MANTPEFREKTSAPINKPNAHKAEKQDNLKNPDVGRVAMDTMAMGEAAESTIGKVSEALSEQRDGDLGSGGGGKGDDKSAKGQAQDIAVIREKLLQKAPTQEMMKKEIEREIKKEISYLHKRAMKMITRPGQIDYSEMNNLIKKVRELKGLLKALLKSSLDNIKTMWLRFVHGIM